jgi:methylthioribose-1-phosphate isomerase
MTDTSPDSSRIERAIDWDGGAVTLIDQTLLPAEQLLLRIDRVDDLIDAIRRLAVRGAPALGVAGALGVVLVLDQAERDGWSTSMRDEAITRLRSCRPTAVNLAWGVDQVR